MYERAREGEREKESEGGSGVRESEREGGGRANRSIVLLLT